MRWWAKHVVVFLLHSHVIGQSCGCVLQPHLLICCCFPQRPTFLSTSLGSLGRDIHPNVKPFLWDSRSAGESPWPLTAQRAVVATRMCVVYVWACLKSSSEAFRNCWSSCHVRQLCVCVCACVWAWVCVCVCVLCEIEEASECVYKYTRTLS